MIEKIFITSCLVMFIWATMWEGMIFGKVRVWFANLADFYKKPFFDCPICQAPWYGTALYWLIWGNSCKEWLIVVFSAAGLNAILVKLFPEK